MQFLPWSFAAPAFVSDKISSLCQIANVLVRYEAYVHILT